MPENEKCWICGADIVESFGMCDVLSKRYCKTCHAKHCEEYRTKVNEYIKLKGDVMFERAMRIMERADCDMTMYKRYAVAVQRHQRDNPELYKSADEIIAAVVMLEQGFDFEMNYKVGRYIVDMYIPSLHVIVEIDGNVHEGRELKDSNRDVTLRQTLGAEWEVIRIPTKYIEQNPKMIPKAIAKLAEDKRKIRKENCGFIPASYSKREAAHYEKATVFRTVRVPQ